MDFPLSVWMLISLVLAAELLAAAWVTILPLRVFLVFAIARDLALILAHGSKVWYWNTYWFGEQFELVALAALAGYACSLSDPARGFDRLLRVPAFAVMVLAVVNNPLTSTGPEMLFFRATAAAIVIVTVLTGVAGLLRKPDCRPALAAGALGIPALFVSGWLFLAGETASNALAPVTWVVAIAACTLLTGQKGSSASGGTPLPGFVSP